MQRDRPLVRGDHRDPPPKRLADVRDPGLAVGGRARRDLHQKVGLGGAKPVDRARPTAHAMLSGNRPSCEGQAQRGRQIEPIASVDQSVARISEANDRHSDAVPVREPLALGVERAQHPPAHRAEANKPDPQRPHGGSGRLRMRKA
jgi:hypothetical protein